MTTTAHWMRSLVFVAVSVGLTIAVVAVLAGQRRTTVQLEGTRAFARLEAAELNRLRAENQRLQHQQISAQETALLRADHAALPRLRAELEALEKSSASSRK